MRLAQAALIVAVALAVCSCGTMGKFRRALDAEERIAKEVSGFYKNAADAYFAIGWEYYSLAETFQKAGQTEEAEKYFHKAKVYKSIHDEWKSLGEQMAQSGELPGPPPAAGR